MAEATTNQTNPPLVDATCKLGDKGCYGNGRCHWLGNCDNKIISNGDMVRHKPNKELAAIIMCPYDTEPDLCNRPGDCLACCEEWLDSAATGGAANGQSNDQK